MSVTAGYTMASSVDNVTPGTAECPDETFASTSWLCDINAASHEGNLHGGRRTPNAVGAGV